MIRFVYNIEKPLMLDNPEASQRALGRAHAKAGKSAMGWFVRHRLRLRFTGQVQDDLHWEVRTAKHDKRKNWWGSKGISHRFRSKTKNKVMAAGGSRVIASSRVSRGNKRTVRLILKDLNPGYRRRPEPGRPPMADELQRMTTQEVDTIAKKYGNVLVQELQREISKANKKRKKIR